MAMPDFQPIIIASAGLLSLMGPGIAAILMATANRIRIRSVEDAVNHQVVALRQRVVQLEATMHASGTPIPPTAAAPVVQVSAPATAEEGKAE